VLERTVNALSRAASWLLVMGLFVLGGNALRYYETRQSADEFRDRSSELYRSAFDPSRTGRIPDPLGLALSKVAELRGGSSEGRLLNEALTDLGAIFEQYPSMDVTLDFARYNLDGVDYTGSAPDMETAQEFRRAWAERAGAAQLGNMQNAPGVGFRFDLSVRW
jgi:type II secretory pathway component PulL